MTSLMAQDEDSKPFPVLRKGDELPLTPTPLLPTLTPGVFNTSNSKVTKFTPQTVDLSDRGKSTPLARTLKVNLPGIPTKFQISNPQLVPIDKPKGRTIVAGGDDKPLDGLLHTRKNQGKQALATALELAGRQNANIKEPVYTPNIIQEYVIPSIDGMIADGVNSVTNRLKSAKTADYQANNLNAAVAQEGLDKNINDFRKNIYESIAQQSQERTNNLNAERERLTLFTNEAINRKNQTEVANATQRAKDVSKLGELAINNIYGHELDNAQNEKNASEYAAAKVMIDSQRELGEYMKQITGKKKAVDAKYSTQLKTFETAYQAETDPIKKTKIFDDYSALQKQYAAENKALDEEYENYKTKVLAENKLKTAKEYQRRVTDFVNPVGTGVKRFKAGGTLSADDQIKVETVKSKLRFSEKATIERMKKDSSLLLAKVKNQLVRGTKNKDRSNKLADDIIRKLIGL